MGSIDSLPAPASISPALQMACRVLDEAKAGDVVCLDVRALTTVMDYMVIASGRSVRHVKAVAEKVIEAAKAEALEYLGTQGLEQAQWVVIDLGDVVVHTMHPETRDFYQLEKLWSTGPDG